MELFRDISIPFPLLSLISCANTLSPCNVFDCGILEGRIEDLPFTTPFFIEWASTSFKNLSMALPLLLLIKLTSRWLVSKVGV